MEREYNITAASWLDLGALQSFERDTFTLDAWPLWDLIAILTLPNIVRIKVVMDGIMVGFAALEHKPREQTDWISTIGVLPTYQKMGIGKALLNECERKSKSTTMRLCVRISNRNAQKLYLNSGYQVSQIWESYYPEGEDALVMQKTLPSRRLL